MRSLTNFLIENKSVIIAYGSVELDKIIKVIAEQLENIGKKVEIKDNLIIFDLNLVILISFGVIPKDLEEYEGSPLLFTDFAGIDKVSFQNHVNELSQYQLKLYEYYIDSKESLLKICCCDDKIFNFIDNEGISKIDNLQNFIQFHQEDNHIIFTQFTDIAMYLRNVTKVPVISSANDLHFEDFQKNNGHLHILDITNLDDIVKMIKKVRGEIHFYITVSKEKTIDEELYMEIYKELDKRCNFWSYIKSISKPIVIGEYGEMNIME